MGSPTTNLNLVVMRRRCREVGDGDDADFVIDRDGVVAELVNGREPERH